MSGVGRSLRLLKIRVAAESAPAAAAFALVLARVWHLQSSLPRVLHLLSSKWPPADSARPRKRVAPSTRHRRIGSKELRSMIPYLTRHAGAPPRGHIVPAEPDRMHRPLPSGPKPILHYAPDLPTRGRESGFFRRQSLATRLRSSAWPSYAYSRHASTLAEAPPNPGST